MLKPDIMEIRQKEKQFWDKGDEWELFVVPGYGVHFTEKPLKEKGAIIIQSPSQKPLKESFELIRKNFVHAGIFHETSTTQGTVVHSYPTMYVFYQGKPQALITQIYTELYQMPWIKTHTYMEVKPEYPFASELYMAILHAGSSSMCSKGSKILDSLVAGQLI